MSAFVNGVLVGMVPTLLLLMRWLSTRGELKRLRETTKDIRAWDALDLTGAESTGRHAMKAEAVAVPEPEPEPATVPIVPGTKRTAMWYDLIADWASAHDPAIPQPPKIAPQPAWFAGTQQLPVVGRDVTRTPQIQNLHNAATGVPPRPKPEPLPTTTWPIWGPEPVAPDATRGERVRLTIWHGIRLGLVEFEVSGQRINAWLAAWIEARIVALIPAQQQAKTAVRPKRYYPMLTASTHRWGYHGDR